MTPTPSSVVPTHCTAKGSAIHVRGRRKHTKAILGLALAVLGSQCAFPQSSGELIPARWLRDGHLIVPEFNFSMASPNPDAHWLYRELPNVDYGTFKSKATAFTVETSTEGDYVVMVMENGGRMDSSDIKRFTYGIQKSMPKGWQVRDVHVQPTVIPVNNSSAFKITLNLPDDSTLYGYGYIVSGKRLYEIINYSREVTEPPQFSRFVASFALLSPSANTLPTSTPENPTSGILMILAIVGAVIDWRYKGRGGVKPTKMDRVYFLLATLTCAMFVIVLGLRGRSAETMGSISGLLIVLLFTLWELGRWHIRRKFPVEISPRRAMSSPLDSVGSTKATEAFHQESSISKDLTEAPAPLAASKVHYAVFFARIAVALLVPRGPFVVRVVVSAA